MDKTQSEVTDKIRCSIKKKLIDLKLFVDDELPDYIMILIANKRTKHHMKKDLSLFLGNQTTSFTNWLWDLVNNLKVGSKIKSSKNSNYALELNQPENVLESKGNKTEEDDVLNYDPAEEGETLCLEELNESVGNPDPVLQEASNNTNLTVPDNLVSQITKSCTSISFSDISKKQVTLENETKHDSINVKQISTETSTKNKPAKVIATSHTSISTSSSHRGISNNSNKHFKYDSTGLVSSIVCTKQRSYTGPAALQANKLLLKAVSDAAKSVLNGKDINEFYKPTPIKDLSIFLEEKNHAAYQSSNELNMENKSSLIESQLNDESSTELNDISNFHFDQSSNLLKKSNTFENDFYDSNLSYQSIPDYISSEEGKEVRNPHFIVTLDGVDFSSLKRKRSFDEPMDIDEEEFAEMESESTKKFKLTERCKYWPTCKNSDNCPYHHPVIPCKCFPDCKFGDKCLYIHPNCKFDSLCSRKDCPYTHHSKRKFKLALPTVVNPAKIQNVKLICKYYPRCTAKLCKFIHPKLCRYGTQCRAPICRYSHFQVPQRDKLKWTANKLY